ncbi:major facilitator superfamily domain-containing protein [Truncatella angustata]|uniref:Major facilitator superfamily domain-containing protein n=1 Tax=Truncatella angustata TaxID=152316 RepID=A0A9P8URW7_9PEZI|nr:major facilitator superfamily domain-containing protein [Truncatella angustata]KAH6657076.1 major facilitator superfamily domain-containing protein [Truncatella angustata]
MEAIVGPLKWFYHEFGVASIYETGRNAWLIILARSLRMIAYGANSLILAIFFSALEFSDHQIGLFMTLTLLGDVFLGTLLTLIADKLGRRRVLLAGSFLMVFSGVMFAVFENFWVLLLAAIVGVISVTGGDFGPFRSIEESILSQLTTPSTRSDVLAWYVTISTVGSSLGSEASGRIIRTLEVKDGWTTVDAYHAIFWVYAVMGIVNALLTLLMTEACELEDEKDYVQVPQSEGQSVGTQQSQLAAPETVQAQRNWFIRSINWLSSRLAQISAPTRSVMYKLWFLLAVDSLADGMVPYSMTNYYMDVTFHPSKATLGDVQSIAYFLGAISSVFAGPLARRIGLINTMVFTHIPSSAAVVLFPFPPVFWLSAVLLFVRAGLNNMDQAPRTAFIAAVVKSEERTAVMGITSMLRTLAAMAGPTITGVLAADNKFWIAFVVAGSCRLAYDLGLYAMFVNMKLYQHENNAGEAGSDTSRGRRELDEEETLEMASLADSDSDFGDDGKEGPLAPQTSTKASLGVPRHETVRSRSPHSLRRGS